MLTKELAEQQLSHIEQSILLGKSSAVTWTGITVEWHSRPLKDGGTLKRKSAYGEFLYSYRDEKLSRSQVISEVLKPLSLRRALIEAEASIECHVCGLIVVGKEAMNPYHSWMLYHGQMVNKPQWGLTFYKMNGNESICLNICPRCMERIYNGEYKGK